MVHAVKPKTQHVSLHADKGIPGTREFSNPGDPVGMNVKDYLNAEAGLRRMLGKKIEPHQPLAPRAVKTYADLQNPSANGKVATSDIAQVDGLYASGNNHVAYRMKQVAAGRINSETMATVANNPKAVDFVLQHVEQRKYVAIHTTSLGTPEERQKIVKECNQVIANFEAAPKLWPDVQRAELITGKIATGEPISNEEKEFILKRPQYLNEYIQEGRQDIREKKQHYHDAAHDKYRRQSDRVEIRNTKRCISAVKHFKRENSLS